MNYELSPWFFATTPPVRPGVYKTRNRVGAYPPHHIIEGYSHFDGVFWGYTRSTPEMATYKPLKSTQQSKEWQGILK